MTFRLTQKQQEANALIAGPAKYILLYGGSRSAKTFTHIRATVTRALIAPGSRHAVLGFRQNRIVQAIVLDTFPKVLKLCFPNAGGTYDKQKGYHTFPNGSEIWFGGLDDAERSEKVLGNEYCLHPDCMVLMSNLTWKRAADVSKHDEIIAFPESLDGHMKLIRAHVLYNKMLYKTRYRVVTNKGTTIVSEGHKFVAYFDDRRTKNFRSLSWRTIEDLQPGDKLRFTIEPWITDRSFNGGWLSGLYDGEGWISSGTIGVAQNIGAVLERAKLIMQERGFSFREHNASKCKHLVATGMWAAMRILGSLRPVRLLKKSHQLWEGRYGFSGRGSSVGSASRHHIRTDARHVAEILSIERLDMGEVRAIQTSSKTLIADGFLGHNCTILLNECSQISNDTRQTVETRLAQKVMIKVPGQPERPLRLKMLFDENPPKKSHWTYKLFTKKINPDDGKPLANPEAYVRLQMNPIDNLENLADGYMESLDNLGAAKRRRFRDGEFGDANPNQLFDEDNFEKYRVLDADELPDMVRIVVAVDPSGSGDTNNEDNDAIGIVVGGLGVDGNAYIIEDRTVKAGPATWGRVATDAYTHHDADVIGGEVNYGGEMVRFVIRTANPKVPFRAVRATRGKVVRAEPVASLYEQGKVRHVGYLRELEDEMVGFTTNGYEGERSPNRADAAIWAIYMLFPALTKPKSNPVIYEPDEPLDSGAGY